MNEFFTNRSTISRARYFRIMVLGSLDVLLTLPLNAINFTVSVNINRSHEIGFWPGLTLLHSHWVPNTVNSSKWRQDGFWNTFNFYYIQWCTVPLALAFFLIFGLTKDVRKSYRDAYWLVMGFVGFKPSEKPVARRSGLSAIVFEAPNRIPARDTLAT